MKALLVSMIPFPGSNASAIRTECLAKILISLGYHVDVFSGGPCTNERIVALGDGLSYVSYKGLSRKLWHRAIDLLRRSRQILRNQLTTRRYDVILLTISTNQVLRCIKREAERYNTPLLYDCVEWYSPNQFTFGALSPTYIQKQQWMTKLIDRQFRVIAISHYLEHHFTSRGLKTSYIPAVMDLHAIQPNKRAHYDGVSLLYAGTPGKKDKLREVMRACAALCEDERSRFRLTLIGVSREQLTSECGIYQEDLEVLGDRLRVFGTAHHDRVLEAYGEADFSILIRPTNMRYAQAGFPTKFVESMATGTPVICNITSDLGHYCVDGVNSIVVQSDQTQDVIVALRSALQLSVEQKQAMREAARACAVENFDYRHYTSAIKVLL